MTLELECMQQRDIHLLIEHVTPTDHKKSTQEDKIESSLQLLQYQQNKQKRLLRKRDHKHIDDTSFDGVNQ